MAITQVFFRNDDVNRMEAGLVEITDLLNGRGIPVSHAVEPANLTEETRSWLLERAPGGVEIIQHGYAHTKHDLGEFGGARSEADQRQDLQAGKVVMEEAFEDSFFPAMSFPFGSYNKYSIPLLEELGYPVVSCHRRHQFSRRVFYALGRALGRGRWLGRHVSHHLDYYPGTRVREISVTIAPIARYLEDQGPTACLFKSQGELQAAFLDCRRHSRVVGVVLHHRYRGNPKALAHLEEFVDWLLEQEDVVFTTMKEIHHGLSRSVS